MSFLWKVWNLVDWWSRESERILKSQSYHAFLGNLEIYCSYGKNMRISGFKVVELGFWRIKVIEDFACYWELDGSYHWSEDWFLAGVVRWVALAEACTCLRILLRLVTMKLSLVFSSVWIEIDLIFHGLVMFSKSNEKTFFFLLRGCSASSKTDYFSGHYQNRLFFPSTWSRYLLAYYMS